MARRPSAGSASLSLSPELSRRNGFATSVTAKRPSIVVADAAQRLGARSTTSFQKLDGLSDVDPDDLFARHTIAEVKMVQQRLRADADAKQQELRLMVGERYRDLLQASTSILSLAKSSKHVLEALEEMRDTVNAITPARAPKRTATGEDKHLQALQSLSAHVKLLLDAPEHLWRLMEKRAYLHAAWLFLLARVVHRALSQEGDDQCWKAYGIDVVEQMPLAQRQWDIITPFRSQISHRATLFLREASSMPGEVCATLLTLHLLESRPLPETLSIYLAQRTKTLAGMLNRNASISVNASTIDSKPNGKVAHRPRKVVIREVKQKAEAILDAIARTANTARCMFADGGPEGSSLMKQALQFFQTPSDNPGSLPPELQLTTQILLTTLPSSSHLLFLPQSIRTYKPYIDSASVTTPTLQSHLRDKLESWFKKAVHDTQGVIADWFAVLDNVREVWGVRVSLLAWLKAVDGLESPERLELEGIVNNACQHQATSVWKAALDLLEVSFCSVVTSAKNTLECDAGDHPYDTQPVEHLFHAPSLPSTLQLGAQGVAAAGQFSRYKASLRQQLTGRTPLLDSALATLERYASAIQNDLTIVLKSGETGSELVAQLSTTYHADAEALCEKICDVLDRSATNEDNSLRSPIFIARICQELGLSSEFFTKLGCNPSTTDAFRERLHGLQTKLVEKWQERTVSHVLETTLSNSSFRRNPALRPTHDTPSTLPSHTLVHALLSLSSEMQQLGVCLDENRRRHQAGATLQRFITSYLANLKQVTLTNSLQILWDVEFLQKLNQLWGFDSTDTSDRITAEITRIRDSLGDAKAYATSGITTSVEEYLSRTQILFASLLPSRSTRPLDQMSPSKSEKTSSLLLYGTPDVESRFEPALELVKTPPRFGLLLVGGATVR